MSPQLEKAIEAIQPLSTTERQQLLQILTQSNFEKESNQDFAISTAQFWRGTSLEEILAVQSPKTIQNLKDFAADFWPEDESIEDFLTFVRQQRQESR